MPCPSRKMLLLRRINAPLATSIKHARRLRLFGVETVHVEDFIVHCCHVRSRIRNSRYMVRGPHRTRKHKFHLCSDEDHDEALTTEEFTFHFRLCRESFSQLVDPLKEHAVFQPKRNDRCRPKPAAHQLLVLLKYLGSEGNQASSVAIGQFFGISKGAVNDCRDNAADAILSLED